MNSILPKLPFLCALFSAYSVAMQPIEVKKHKSLLELAKERLVNNIIAELKHFDEAQGQPDFSLVLNKVNAIIQNIPSDIIPRLEAGLYERSKEKLFKLFSSKPFKKLTNDESDFYASQIQFSPAGKFLMVVQKHKDGYRKKRIQIYSLPNFKLLKTLKIKNSYVKFSPRGKFLCLYNKQDKEIALIDMNSNFEIKRLALETGVFTFNDDESMLLCVNESKKNSGNSIEIIDIASGQLIKANFKIEGMIVGAVAQGNYIFVGVNDSLQYGHFGLIFLISLNDRRIEYRLIDATDKKAHSGCWEFELHKEKGLLAISSYERVRIFDLKTNSWVLEFKHQELINSLSFNKQGTKLVTSSSDWSAAIWDLSCTEPTYMCIEDSRHIVQYAGFAPHENFVFTSDSAIHLWDISKENPTEILSLAGNENLVHGITQSPKGMFFAPKYGESVYCFPAPGIFSLPELAWLSAASHTKYKREILKSFLDEVFKNRPLIFRTFLRKMFDDA